MHDGSGRVVAEHLSKRFGPITAVNDLSFEVHPGSVTGFLGPNGAGKTTTLRMIVGLVTPTSGHSTINGVRFEALGEPGRVVGAVLESQGFHPGRSGRNHLKVYAAAMGVADRRAEELLDLVGLRSSADRKVGGYSLGMKQRLALASALLGDPQVLVLDEPGNGLDPEGIAWLRQFLRSYAANGRTVLISSHLLAEVEQTVDQVVIISRGQTMYYGQLEDLRRSQQIRVIVQPADPGKLTTALREAGFVNLESTMDGKLAVNGATAKQIGDIAASAGVALYGVAEQKTDLEQLFFQLTSGPYGGMPQQPGPQPPQQGPPCGWGPPPPQGPPPQPGYQQQGDQQPPHGYQPPGRQEWGPHA